jgi:ribosomal protein S27E
VSNVIQIDEMRLTQKSRFEMGRRADCRHLHLTTDEEGDIVKCDDCGMQVSAFWALRMLSEHYERAMAKLKNRERAQAMAEEKTIHLKAAQTVESAWRSRSMVPTCPHCGEGIAPTDGFGRSAINKQIDERRRAERRKV